MIIIINIVLIIEELIEIYVNQFYHMLLILNRKLIILQNVYLEMQGVKESQKYVKKKKMKDFVHI